MRDLGHPLRALVARRFRTGPTLWAATLAVVVCCACGGDVPGPHTRVRRFTGCAVPASVVELRDAFEGEGNRVFRARVVMKDPDVPAFLRSCGFEGELDEELRPAHVFAPGAPVFWDPLADAPAAGGAAFARAGGALSVELFVMPRDTDVVVFVWSSEGSV